jgi:hypothetical protein
VPNLHPNAMPLAAGTRLGPYEIQTALGAGGMGEVYKARDTRLDRRVAIKVLAPSIADDPAVRARFEREARAVAALDHPHICGIYDVGESNGRHYFVMPHLDGQTLADRLRKGALPLERHQRVRARRRRSVRDRVERPGRTGERRGERGRVCDGDSRAVGVRRHARQHRHMTHHHEGGDPVKIVSGSTKHKGFPNGSRT